MHIRTFAVGLVRGTHESALCEDYRSRADTLGKKRGFQSVTIEEVAVSRKHQPRERIVEESERLCSRIPDQAHVICLDAKGKGMTSEAFAEMLGAMRDAGARDLAFLIGGPDGLNIGPKIKPGRSLAFGPQTWPHLLVRVMLAEQIYRAVTILAGHPYHRP